MKSSKKEKKVSRERREEERKTADVEFSVSWRQFRKMCMLYAYACGCEIVSECGHHEWNEIYQFVAFSIISSIWMPETQLQWPFSIRKTSICFLLIKHARTLLSWHAKANTHKCAHITCWTLWRASTSEHATMHTVRSPSRLSSRFAKT